MYHNPYPLNSHNSWRTKAAVQEFSHDLKQRGPQHVWRRERNIKVTYVIKNHLSCHLMILWKRKRGQQQIDLNFKHNISYTYRIYLKKLRNKHETTQNLPIRSQILASTGRVCPSPPRLELRASELVPFAGPTADIGMWIFKICQSFVVQ